jgi:hypothetical protein
MDTSLLVEFQLEAGRRLISQLTYDGFEVAAAFWATTPDDDNWYLYIATPLVELHGSAQSYRMLLESLQKLEGTPLSFSDIKLIGATTPIARDVLNVLEKSSGKLGMNYSGKTLGGMVVDKAFLYYRHLYDAEESQKFYKKEIYRSLLNNLMRGPGVYGPNKITLRDGSSFMGFLTTLNVNSEGEASAVFLVAGSDEKRQFDIDDIVSIE